MKKLIPTSFELHQTRENLPKATTNTEATTYASVRGKNKLFLK